MKFHTPSFLMGFASATVIAMTGKRLKPVAVELGALGVHLAHLGWGMVERQREHVEDLWAEIEERTHSRRHTPSKSRSAVVTHSVHIETAVPRNGTDVRR